MRKQAIKVSPFELRCLANKLQTDFEEGLSKLDVKIGDNEINQKKFLVNIINKTKDSDTWEFEEI